MQLALLNPIHNPDLELAIVMFIVPFFINVSFLCYELFFVYLIILSKTSCFCS